MTGVLRAKVGGQWVDVSTVGPTGPQGVPGPPGPPGEGGGGGGTDEVVIATEDPIATYPDAELWYDPDAVAPASSYVHNQGAPASTWVVVHNLNVFPNVTVEDSSGTTVEGELVHDNTNQLTLTFSAAFSGVAYCS